MRVVHLAPPDAVAARLAALDSGFDDALTTAMPVSELAGRLTWLDAKARHRPGSGSVHVIGMASSWTSSRTSSGGGDEVIHLRPKEFGLLSLRTARTPPDGAGPRLPARGAAALTGP